MELAKYIDLYEDEEIVKSVKMNLISDTKCQASVATAAQAK